MILDEDYKNIDQKHCQQFQNIQKWTDSEKCRRKMSKILLRSFMRMGFPTQGAVKAHKTKLKSKILRSSFR